jgi:hypothetical protein
MGNSEFIELSVNVSELFFYFPEGPTTKHDVHHLERYYPMISMFWDASPQVALTRFPYRT